jgi:L-seryl-tRNA(Ser) seleniumtransferase
MADLSTLPSVDRLLRHADAAPLITAHGRHAVTEAIRDELAGLREKRETATEDALLARVAGRLEAAGRSSLRPVFNLTGTVLHTNLGRALLPE